MDEQDRLYKMLIYVAVATLHFYRKAIIPLNDGELCGVFAEKNKEVLKRVFDEVLIRFNYELSSNQIGAAVKAYSLSGISVADTEVGGKPCKSPVA